MVLLETDLDTFVDVEYGPPPEYTPTRPGTEEALYDVWEQTELAAEQLRALHSSTAQGT